MFGQAEQSLGVVFTHTEKDELKKSHTAASMKKREKERKKKKNTEREKTQNQQATINDLTAVTHVGCYSYTEEYQPSLSLFGRAEKKRDASYFAASEAMQAGSRERREGA